MRCGAPRDLPPGSAETSAKEAMTVVVASLADQLGFTHSSTDSLNILTDIACQYLERNFQRLHRTVEHAGRSRPVLSDVQSLFRHLRIDEEEMVDYVNQCGSRSELSMPPLAPERPSTPIGIGSQYQISSEDSELSGVCVPKPEYVPSWAPPILASEIIDDTIRERLADISIAARGKPRQNVEKKTQRVVEFPDFSLADLHTLGLFRPPKKPEPPPDVRSDYEVYNSFEGEMGAGPSTSSMDTPPTGISLGERVGYLRREQSEEAERQYAVEMIGSEEPSSVAPEDRKVPMLRLKLVKSESVDSRGPITTPLPSSHPPSSPFVIPSTPMTPMTPLSASSPLVGGAVPPLLNVVKKPRGRPPKKKKIVETPLPRPPATDVLDTPVPSIPDELKPSFLLTALSVDTTPLPTTSQSIPGVPSQTVPTPFTPTGTQPPTTPLIGVPLLSVKRPRGRPKLKVIEEAVAATDIKVEEPSALPGDVEVEPLQQLTNLETSTITASAASSLVADVKSETFPSLALRLPPAEAESIVTSEPTVPVTHVPTATPGVRGRPRKLTVGTPAPTPVVKPPPPVKATPTPVRAPPYVPPMETTPYSLPKRAIARPKKYLDADLPPSLGGTFAHTPRKNSLGTPRGYMTTVAAIGTPSSNKSVDSPPAKRARGRPKKLIEEEEISPSYSPIRGTNRKSSRGRRGGKSFGSSGKRGRRRKIPIGRGLEIEEDEEDAEMREMEGDIKKETEQTPLSSPLPPTGEGMKGGAAESVDDESAMEVDESHPLDSPAPLATPTLTIPRLSLLGVKREKRREIKVIEELAIPSDSSSRDASPIATTTVERPPLRLKIKFGGRPTEDAIPTRLHEEEPTAESEDGDFESGCNVEKSEREGEEEAEEEQEREEDDESVQREEREEEQRQVEDVEEKVQADEGDQPLLSFESFSEEIQNSVVVVLLDLVERVVAVE